MKYDKEIKENIIDIVKKGRIYESDIQMELGLKYHYIVSRSIIRRLIIELSDADLIRVHYADNNYRVIRYIGD